MIEWLFDVDPLHASINPARKCKCSRSKRTGKAIGTPYTRPEYDDAKHRIHSDALFSMLGDEAVPVFADGPVHIQVITRSKNVHRKGPANGLAFIDTDATTKCVLDALIGVAYTDDSQVSRVVADKTTEGPVGIRVRIYRPDEDTSAWDS